MLKFLLEVTAEFLGHDRVNKAVIAVPAKFNSVQRQATGEAYKQAGLKVRLFGQLYNIRLNDI